MKRPFGKRSPPQNLVSSASGGRSASGRGRRSTLGKNFHLAGDLGKGTVGQQKRRSLFKDGGEGAKKRDYGTKRKLLHLKRGKDWGPLRHQATALRPKSMHAPNNERGGEGTESEQVGRKATSMTHLSKERRTGPELRGPHKWKKMFVQKKERKDLGGSMLKLGG